MMWIGEFRKALVIAATTLLVAGSVVVSEGQDLAGKHLGYVYEPVEVDVTPSIPSYDLPLDPSDVDNLKEVLDKLDLPMTDRLLENGFVVFPATYRDDFVEAYEKLHKSGVPLYVTSDCVLHLFHMQFAENLRRIEQDVLITGLEKLLDALSEQLRRVRPKDGVEEEALGRATAFLFVAQSMLGDRSSELAQIMEARGVIEDMLQTATSHGYTQDMEAILEFQKRYTDLLRPIVHIQPHGGFRRPGGEWGSLFRSEDLELLLEKIDGHLKDARPAEGQTKSVPVAAAALAKRELGLIERHVGFEVSPVFNYLEDYSQYVPRGHYTRSEALKRHFKAMMWLGRMTFLLNGGEPHGPTAPDYLVSAEEAEIQRTAAAYLAEALRSSRVEGGAGLETWKKIYEVTAFFSGWGDDLTLADLIDIQLALDTGTSMVRTVRDGETLQRLRAELKRRGKPSIYSGTGESWILDPEALHGEPSAESHDQLLQKTAGFRFMGQRFLPDAYAMGRLGWPTVGQYTGRQDDVFTLDKRWQKRFFPWSLDVASVLGSERAREVSAERDESAYLGYEEELERITLELNALGVEDWNRNLYWSWLYSLKALLVEFGPGYQAYMQTPAWHDEKLGTCMGSWAQLRHDTILYAKQPYIPTAGSREVRIQVDPAYVEPVPELYASLLATLRFMRRVFEQYQVLEVVGTKGIESSEGLLQRLLDISRKEIQDEPLTDEDYEFIRYFASWLRNAVAGAERDAQKTTLVADVLTDQNNGLVIEEATGNLGLVVVINMLSDGALAASAGPVFTYYEFKHPMDDRLTDEKWREMIATDPRYDLMPAWTASFMESR